MYVRIHRSFWLCFGCFPNLISGETYNEKIQWLKLFGQDPRMVDLTDKLALKACVEAKLGAAFVPRTLQAGRSAQELDFSAFPLSFVLKANHDSGSVLFAHNNPQFPQREFKRRLDRALARVFGLRGGEWQYWPITPQVFAEEMLPFAGDAPPPDYKFHCANGRVLWLQYIYDRGRDTREVITDRDCKVLGVHFDHKMAPMFEFQKPANWNALVATAEAMASDFPYVRVDLYDIPVNESENRILVGEMTFTPLNGAYQSEGNEVLGRMLPLDRTVFREPISPDYVQPLLRNWLKQFAWLRSLRQTVRQCRVSLHHSLLRVCLPLVLRWHHPLPHTLTAPVIVSLTSYPPRFPVLASTLRCLLRQSVRPDKLILWIAEDDYESLPEEVLSLQRFGLTIERTRDMKPYKKLIPALEEYGFDVNHVIADDDMYYPSHWLETLLQQGDGSSVVCHFSREWMNSLGMVPTYRAWRAMLPGTTSTHGLLIGHGGVWFPPGSLGVEACDYPLAEQLCPLQDDIWFSWHALMRGYKISRTARSVPRFSWPGADDCALSRENNPEGGGNDLAINRMLEHYGAPFLHSKKG